MIEQQERQAGSGLVDAAAVFPKWDADALNEALSEFTVELGVVEQFDPALALRIAKSLNKITGVLNA